MAANRPRPPRREGSPVEMPGFFVGVDRIEMPAGTAGHGRLMGEAGRREVMYRGGVQRAAGGARGRRSGGLD
jgi:hypothetical protein